MAVMQDVIVVGGGVIGLSIAREIAKDGGEVLLLERGELGEGASWAAAGMLAPQSEAARDNAFFRLCSASREVYPRWLDSLSRETGIDASYSRSGLLYLAGSSQEMSSLDARFSWQQQAGMKVQALSAQETCELEPAITMPIAGALLMSEESHVTPRKLVSALIASCLTRNVKIRTRQLVSEVLSDGGSAAGVRVEAERIFGGTIVIASGAWTSQIRGVAPQVPISPRKGQILCLAARTPVLTHIVRWGETYAVQRASGELVIGATDENAGFDRSMTASGVGKLLAAAQQLSSATSCLPIQDMWSGLRPAAPDGLPVLGWGELPNLLFATGHYRNGVLLAPVTASIASALVQGRPSPSPLEPFRPSRFAAQASVQTRE
jgi:glycine oxidase